MLILQVAGSDCKSKLYDTFVYLISVTSEVAGMISTIIFVNFIVCTVAQLKSRMFSVMIL